MLALLPACKSLMESTKGKQINIDTQIYGFKATFVDPGSGSISPTGAMGFGSINYRSVPMEPGQPFFATYQVKSIWSKEPASTTTIWVGRASEKSILQFEAVPAGMIKIGLDGIKTQPELKIVPDTKADVPDH